MMQRPNNIDRPARRDAPSFRVPRSAFRVRSGFTLIEMLVVIAIILALLGILIGAVGAFSKVASGTAAQQMMAAIEMGLKNYHNDHGTYPPSNAAVAGVGGANAGGYCLAGAMFAPLSTDGHTGLGWREGYVASGKRYGPYLSTKHESNLQKSGNNFWITMADSPGKTAVLYYKFAGTGQTGKNIGAAGGVWSSDGRFNVGHNSGLDTQDATTYWKSGTLGNSGFPTVSERDGFAASLRAAKFLLVYAGPDDKHGTEDDLIVTGK